MAGSMKRTKKANKKATRGINSKWKKGQSAGYNPVFNKFRLEAKNRRVFGEKGGSNLTEAKLAEHNKITSDQQCEEDADLMSIGGDSAISAFTNCSLPTFSRLIKNWNMESLLHKEMIAVLAAVSDILKERNGGKETETEYFDALIVTLDAVGTNEEITAVVCLLSMVVKRLDGNFLKHKYDTCDTCNLFTKLLSKKKDSDHTALLRNLLKIVYIFLKAKNEWSDSTCKKFKDLLEFTVHHKHKVRKTAHEIVRSLIVDCSPELKLSQSGCEVAAKFCISKLESNGGPKSNSKEVFYILSLLEETLGVFPKDSLKSLCETILRVMTLSNSLVTSACLRTLRGIFKMKPKSDSLPSDLNARLITALYDYQPNVKESQSLVNWLSLMEVAFINLRRLDDELCIKHLPKFYDTAVKCWQNDNDDVLQVVTSVLKNLLYQCVRPSEDTVKEYLQNDPANNPLHKMFHIVEESLSYQYHRAWKYVLNVLASFFEVIGRHSSTVMLKCLRSLADLHDSYRFPHISEVEKAIGMAIQHMGPKVILEAIPLQINDKNDKPDFPRSWLLPLLRDNIKRTELQFFVNYFMPLAAKLRNKVNLLQKEQKIVESKLYDLLCSQIWSLLPGFCNEPTDLKEHFKDIAKTLGVLLIKEPTLRMTVLSSLRLLISKNIENVENRKVLSKYSNNYLRTLFNIYLTQTKDKTEEKVRLTVYETCKAFLQIADKNVCEALFKESMEELKAVNSSDFMQQSIIDSCRIILPYVDAFLINSMYEYCKPLLEDSNHTTQKKAYSVFYEICGSKAESCKKFVIEHLEEIKPLLCEAVKGLKPATRALRLNILAHITKHLSLTEKKFLIESIVPEAVLCTKENSVKARAAAYNLLIVIGHTLLDWQPNHKEALNDYLKVLFAGLAEDKGKPPSPHKMSATMLAIGRVLYEFKDKMDSNLIHMLVENACLLLTSKSREVVVSTISFLKILFSVMDNADLAQHVELLVKSITGISEDNQRHFRFKAKELLTRLIRKFGYEMISKLVPESYQKQISHIRKMEARKANKKDVDIDDDDDDESKTFEGFDAILADSDEEMPLETDTDKPTKMTKKKRKNIETMIEEHGEDDIVDLLDPSINMRLLTKKTEKAAAVKQTEKGFPVSEDGRLIITEDDGDDDASKLKQNKEGDERREILAELGALFKKNKRKYQESDDGDDEKFGDSAVKRGIHRTLDPKSKKTPGAEFKAKKAGGDVKKGKFEPYAYVPLNRQMLNKRKQVKVKGQFKSLVKGAKKGAMIGAKRKMRQARKRKNNK